MKQLKLDRRALLRGAGGAVLGLPLLEIMLSPREAYAQSAALKRYLIMTSGQSTGQDGSSENFFVPDAVGALRGQTMKPALAGLTDLLDDFTIVSGLQIPSQGLDGNTSKPAGGKDTATHDKTLSPLLAGRAATGDNYGASGATSDYLVAQQIGGTTPFRQINYRVQLDEINGHFAEISYSASGRPVNNSVADPAVAWQTLFSSFTPPTSGGTPTTPTVDPVVARNALRRRSVLDAILESSKSLSARLGASDMSRLSAHLDEVRSLERRVARLAAPPDPMDPGVPVGSACERPAQPGSFTRGNDYNDEIKRGEVLVDLIAMALACDLTRVASLLISFSMPMFTLPNHRMDIHEESHSGSRTDFLASQVWHLSLFGRMLRALKAMPEAGGTVLDHSAVIFLLEAGHGRDAAAGGSSRQAHSTDNMVVLIGGDAGGVLERGQHIKPAPAGSHPNGSAKPRHPASVLTTCMNAVGGSATGLGDVSGTIPELLR